MKGTQSVDKSREKAVSGLVYEVAELPAVPNQDGLGPRRRLPRLLLDSMFVQLPVRSNRKALDEGLDVAVVTDEHDIFRFRRCLGHGECGQQGWRWALGT